MGLDWTNPFGQESQDLSSDAVWERVLRDVGSGRYDFAHITPAAGTSHVRRTDGGAGSLRAAEYPYGGPRGEVTHEDHETIRLGTHYVLQCARAARAALSIGAGFALAGAAPLGTTTFAVPFGTSQRCARSPWSLRRVPSP